MFFAPVSCGTKNIIFLAEVYLMSIELEQITADVKQLVSKYGSDRNALMPILHELEKKYHEVPSHSMQVLADMMGIHAVEIQDVVSFFHFYSTEKTGKFIIRLCKDMPCKMQEAAALASQLEKELGIKFGETTKDSMFTLEWASCIGMCDQGPAMLINDQPYTHVKLDEVRNILEKCKKEGK
jgi:NADH:ubiquinone oxidoreductase subunit E